jgi:ribonucleoside-diphosphate reductase alpha chain
MTGNKLIQEVQFFDKYSRWNEQLGRRETWDETVERVWEFFKKHTPLAKLDDSTYAMLFDAFERQEVLPAMRIVQMAGPALERCNVGAYNCSYSPIESFKDIADILYILMQGTGAGFSVEKKYVNKLPAVGAKQALIGFHTVEDTTEGWANSVLAALDAASRGFRVEFDYSQVRAKGTRLKTKGGVASGPEPLMNLHNFIYRKFDERRSFGHLRPIDVYDIVCMVGYIVEVGGVRRAALMCLCDLDDEEMKNAKQGEFWNENPQRSRSNNSAVYDSLVPPSAFAEEFASLKASGTGERGIFNREVARVRSRIDGNSERDFGTNPCGEIILRPRQFCNLSIAVARRGDSLDDLARKVRLATVFGTLQATLTNFNYISPKFKENCEEERLLGVDITGQLDNEVFSDIFRHGETILSNSGRDEYDDLLADLGDVAGETNYVLAKQFGIPHARAITTVKPSGNSSQLLDCSSGLHPRFSPYYIRRLRIGADSPVAKVLEEVGVPGEMGIGETTIKVFSFPVKSPDGSVTRHESSAIRQLNYWAYMTMYTDHNPSCTVYVKPHEWEHVEQWLRDHFDGVNGLSFLPYDGGVYQQAPYEEITEQQYNELASAMPDSVNWPELLKKYEQTDTTTSARELACLGGVCEL